MRIWSRSFQDGSEIPVPNAFAEIDPVTHVRLAGNRNPHLAWDEVPAGTESLVLICHDQDVPSEGTDVNQEGRTVPATLARVDFFHWSLIDIPVTLRAIEEGQFTNGVTARGKAGPEVSLTAPDGSVLQLRHGINDYTGWFAADADMQGDYYGYDGPCPPWNDTRMHHYIFTLYALDIARLPLTGRFSGPDVRAAIQGHILDEARLFGLYTLNPALAGNRS